MLLEPRAPLFRSHGLELLGDFRRYAIHPARTVCAARIGRSDRRRRRPHAPARRPAAAGSIRPDALLRIGGNHFHLRSFAQPVRAVDHDLFVGLQRTVDGHPVAIDRAGHHDARAHRGIGVDDIDVEALRTAKYRRTRHGEGILQRVELQNNTDCLIRKQRIVSVGKQGLDFDRVRGRIDRVVDGLDAADGELLAAAAVPRLDRNRRVRMQARSDQRHVGRRDGEHECDRPGLRDGDDAIGVARLNDIA